MRDRIGSWAWPLLAAAVVWTGPAVAGSRTSKPAKVETKPAVTAAPAPAVAPGKLYAVVLGPGPAWKKGQPFKGPGLDAHRQYWKGLHAAGRVAAAGPLGDRSGLALIRARSQKEADALVAADPAVRARVLVVAARPYSAELVSAAVLVGK